LYWDGNVSANQLAEKLGLQSKTGAFKRTLQELLEQKFVEYTIPEKPQSRMQKYRLTEAGRKRIKDIEMGSEE